MATQTQTRRELRQSVRLVKAMLAGHCAVLGDNGCASVAANDALLTISALTLKNLCAKGILATNGTEVVTRTEASAWLRRQLSAGDGFAQQHRTPEAGPQGTVRNVEASVLLKLARGTQGQAYLTPHQLAAAERLSKWGEQARLNRRVTMSYSPLTASAQKGQAHAGDISDLAVDARKKLDRMCRKLPRDCAQALLDVCVYEKSLGEIERNRQWPKRSAKLVLRIGLDLLAQDLGFAPHAEGRPDGGPIGQWRDQSATPRMPE